MKMKKKIHPCNDFGRGFQAEGRANAKAIR
jgi:hypothetical protein